MKKETIKISVVAIAWYKEAEMYPELLDSLLHQSIPRRSYEIIIVDDASDKATQKAVKPYLKKFPDTISLHKVRKNLRGLKRNFGATRARADIVLFIDGDMVGDKHLLEEHLSSHKKYEGSVLGYFNNVYDSGDKKGRFDKIFFDYISKTSDQNLFEGKTGDALEYRFFYTGNVSVRKSVFQEIGGFDEGFNQYGVEDIDLGYRLEIKNERLYFNRKAKSTHRYSPSFNDYCAKKRDAGRSLAYFTDKYRHLYRHFYITRRETVWLWIKTMFFFLLSWTSVRMCEKYIEAAIRYNLFAGFVAERSKRLLKILGSESEFLG